MTIGELEKLKREGKIPDSHKNDVDYILKYASGIIILVELIKNKKVVT